MISGRIFSFFLLGFAFVALPTVADPGQLSGLVAWYHASDLEESAAEGEKLKRWPDRSGKGNDLIAGELGDPATWVAGRIGGQPVLRPGAGGRFDLTNPIKIEDHTIAVVFRPGERELALFRGKKNPNQGVYLVGKERGPSIQLEGAGAKRLRPYGGHGLVRKPHWLMIGAASGKLRSIVDGEDLSSGESLSAALEIAKLFQLKRSAAVARDGATSEIAEIAIFDRWLEASEREQWLGYVRRTYGLGDADPREGAIDVDVLLPGMAVLENSASQSLTVGENLVVWGSEVVEAPFEFDSTRPTRVYAHSATRARLTVSVPIQVSEGEASFRLLFRKNGSAFLIGEDRRDGPAASGVLRADSFVSLEPGDFVEVVCLVNGSRVTAALASASALLMIEER